MRVLALAPIPWTSTDGPGPALLCALLPLHLAARKGAGRTTLRARGAGSAILSRAAAGFGSVLLRPVGAHAPNGTRTTRTHDGGRRQTLEEDANPGLEHHESPLRSGDDGHVDDWRRIRFQPTRISR